MTAALIAMPHEVGGSGWKALIYSDHITIATGPWTDRIDAAIQILLTPDRRPLWLVRWIGEDEQGWDLWRAERSAD